MRLVSPDDIHAYNAVCASASRLYEASPYGNSWRDFTAEELAAQAAYKAKRFCLLPHGHPKQLDDALDAINMLIFSVRKLQEEESSKLREESNRKE